MDMITDISEVEWLAFVDQVASASIFQSPVMSRVFRGARGYRPQVVAAIDARSVKAVLASTLASPIGGRLGRFGTRSVIVGGPIGDVSVFSDLLQAHDLRSSSSALLTQIRNIDSHPDRGPFERTGYCWQDHLNYVLNLQGGQQAILRGMSKARRKSLERAEESGLEWREVGLRDLREAYNVLRATYTRAQVPLADESLFRSALDVLSPKGNVWLGAASREGVVCAVRFVLPWRTTIYDWYAGSSQIGRDHHADEWLVWQVIKRGIDEGYSTFDFLGAGRPGENFGPGEFKRRFGGRLTNPGRFEKVYRPLAFKVSSAAYEIGRKLRWVSGFVNS